MRKTEITKIDKMKHARIEEEKAVVEQMIRLYCQKREGNDKIGRAHV